MELSSIDRIAGLIHLCDIALKNDTEDDYHPPLELLDNQVSFFQRYHQFQHDEPISKEEIIHNILITYGCALELYPFGCIQKWRFLDSRLSQHPKICK